MKRPTAFLTLVVLALLLAACQDPAPTSVFEGTTTTAGIEQPLSLRYDQHGDRLVGAYQVRAATGVFRGVLNGITVTADLTPSPSCTYTFEGTLAGSTLTGAFEPTACAGGESGTWTLERQ